MLVNKLQGNQFEKAKLLAFSRRPLRGPDELDDLFWLTSPEELFAQML